jgi:hypothetical protein
MVKTLLTAALLLTLALPAFAWTYKTSYPAACSEVWPAVKDVLSHPDNYEVKATDDAKMHADYQVKHSAHVNVSGALLQRTNKVTLVAKGDKCEMQVVSNYSGWEHNDQGDFKKRVEESMAKEKNKPPSLPADAKPEAK